MCAGQSGQKNISYDTSVSVTCILASFLKKIVYALENKPEKQLPVYCRLAAFDNKNRPMHLEATDNKASSG